VVELNADLPSHPVFPECTKRILAGVAEIVQATEARTRLNVPDDEPNPQEAPAQSKADDPPASFARTRAKPQEPPAAAAPAHSKADDPPASFARKPPAAVRPTHPSPPQAPSPKKGQLPQTDPTVDLLLRKLALMESSHLEDQTRIAQLEKELIDSKERTTRLEQSLIALQAFVHQSSLVHQQTQDMIRSQVSTTTASLTRTMQQTIERFAAELREQKPAIGQLNNDVTALRSQLAEIQHRLACLERSAATVMQQGTRQPSGRTRDRATRPADPIERMMRFQ
jgi:hypothetical protein